MPEVTVYKVTMPFWFAYPAANVTLSVAFTKDEAQKFVDGYPNPFVKPFLNIETVVHTYGETD